MFCTFYFILFYSGIASIYKCFILHVGGFSLDVYDKTITQENISGFRISTVGILGNFLISSIKIFVNNIFRERICRKEKCLLFDFCVFVGSKARYVLCRISSFHFNGWLGGLCNDTYSTVDWLGDKMCYSVYGIAFFLLQLCVASISLCRTL